jgi:thioester reductase-like protein
MRNLMNKNEPIAIVGIGCRFPGGVVDPESFWNLLSQGKNGISEIPADRWDLKKFSTDNKTLKGKIYTDKGGFIEDIDQFEPEFFGISPREAKFMDPQQRIALEVAWEALEEGGFIPAELGGKKVGVYIGSFMHDFANTHSKYTEHQNLGLHSATGVAASVIANRVSYIFDFKGPSLVIDTACSSSLVALHYACRDLWAQETELALAGGINLIINPEMYMILGQASMLSADGYCKAFDKKADGYARAEGAGLVVLKPLSKAVEDQNNIYAIIRGTSINQNGQGEGLTVPSEDAQKSAICDAVHMSGVEPKDIQYVEAHGTGTEVGDPIEAQALGGVYSKDRPLNETCAVGSVKSNFGHAESAAGIAGVIKTALMLRHRHIPPNLHFESPNPKIPFAELQLRVPTSLEAWPRKDNSPRLAGVNSSGFGGANGHVILEEWVPKIGDTCSNKRGEDFQVKQKEPYLFPFSGHSEEALKAQCRAFHAFLKKNEFNSDVDLQDISHTVSLHKSHQTHRICFVAESKTDLKTQLMPILTGETGPKISKGVANRAVTPKIAFVFSGMGQQSVGMGKRLMQHDPLFKSVIQKCDLLFQQHTREWSLIDELTAKSGNSRIHETQIAQPCIFSLQVALTELWRSWEIIPSAIVGHSVGEIAAAYSAGVLNLEDAVQVCYHRSRLQQKTAGLGTMLAVGLSTVEAEKLINDFKDQISIGAVNSNESVTLSGDTEALRKIAALLTEQNKFNRFLKVEVPYHSPAMDPIKDELKRSIGDISPQVASTALISTVTGEFVNGKEIDAAYWPKNIREPVRFTTAFDRLLQSEHNLFIEISAHPVLAVSMLENLKHSNCSGQALPSLRRGEPGKVTMLNSAGLMYSCGHPINWQLINGRGGNFIHLPSYVWTRTSYWNESEESQQLKKGSLDHPLLGHRLESPEPTWKTEIDLQILDYLNDHCVENNPVFPAAAYIEMALAAAQELFEDQPFGLEEFQMVAPLMLRRDKPVTLQFQMQDTHNFSIFSRSSTTQQIWTQHACGSFVPGSSLRKPGIISVDDIQNSSTQEVAKKEIYQELEIRHLNYGPLFQNIDHLWMSDTEVLGRVNVNEKIHENLEDYILHPVVLDACFQMVELLALQGTYIPVSIDNIVPHLLQEEIHWGMARVLSRTPAQLTCHLVLLNKDGACCLEVENILCQRLMLGDESASNTVEDHLYEFQWQSKELNDLIRPRRAAAFLPEPEYLAKEISPEITRLTNHYQRDAYYKTTSPALDSLGTEFVISALFELGWTFERNRILTIQELADQLLVKEDQRHLFSRMLENMAEVGILNKSGDQWRVVSQPNKPDPNRMWRQVLAEHPSLLAELTLLGRCGVNLKGILTGEIDPLSVIFLKDSSAAEHLYQDSPSFRIYNRMMRQVVSSMIQHLPEGETLRVLEIGAGTGALTSHLLPLFPGEQTTYTFTDISAMFTVQAEQKFMDYDFLEYKPLDLEKDPREQGFTPQSFDLVLACDVLHATSDLKQTLERIQMLLAPGGALAFIEINRAPIWIELIFGTLSGWWSFADFDIRPTHPIISAEQWIDLLHKVGFQGAVEISDFGSESKHSIIVAKTPQTAQTGPLTSAEIETEIDQEMVNRPVLVLTDDSGVADRLTQKLKQKRLKPVCIKIGTYYSEISLEQYLINPENPNDFRQLFQSLCLDKAAAPIIINLWNLDTPKLDSIENAIEKTTTADCIRNLHLVQALMNREWDNAPCLWFVSSGTQTVGGVTALHMAQTPVWGMRRVIANEHPNFRTWMIDLSPEPDESEMDALCHELLTAGDYDEIALRGQRRYVNRLVRKTHFRGDDSSLASFGLFENPHRSNNPFSYREIVRAEPGAGQLEIKVEAIALNSADDTQAPGRPAAEMDEQGLISNFGSECAGKVIKVGSGVTDFREGDTVFGLGTRCYSEYAILDVHHLVAKPGNISFEEAATIPVAFLNAYYALHELARVKQGDRILIHGGASDIGLAAIQVSMEAGAEVLTTAGTPEKRDFLRSTGVSYVGDSRSLDFANEIESLIGSENIDIIINTLSGKAIRRSINLLTPVTGSFVDISNNQTNQALTLNSLKRGVSFFSFDLDEVRRKRPSFLGELLKKIVAQIEVGEYHPLPHRVYSSTNVIDAFKSFRKSNHIGKTCISLNEPGIVPILKQTAISARSDGTYLITGGLGGFGLAVAKWLVDCGAKHLVLIGRSGAGSDKAKQQVDELIKLGAEVVVEAADVTQAEDIAAIITKINLDMPPLKGVIHAAMVLNINILMQMNADDMRRVMNPKILGAWNLHCLTQGNELDFFILFSSIVNYFGTAGQSSYSAANSFLDSLAHYRRANGLPALSINWGAIGEAGYFAEHESFRDTFKRQGIEALTLNQAWQTLYYGFQKNLVQIGVVPVDWTVSSRYITSIAKTPRLSHLININENKAETEKFAESESSASLPDSLDERKEFLSNLLSSEMAKILGIPSDKLGKDQFFEDLGFDSLMAVEYGARIDQLIHLDLPKMVFLQGGMNIEGLVDVVENELSKTKSTKTGEETKTILPVIPTDVDFLEEAALDESITPGPLSIKINFAPKNILLTGATGFLGAYLLKELLEVTQAGIVCLVRAANPEDGMYRIQRNLEAYDLWQSGYASRITALPGDLTSPRLGLNDIQWLELAEEIEVIFHSAARLNFAMPYSALRATNVLGTIEILKLACLKTVKPIHYISTLAKISQIVPDPNQVIAQHMDPLKDSPFDSEYIRRNGFNIGYHQSKWVADELMCRAEERGVPVVIYRSSLISGDSRTGMWNTNDYICQLLKGCIQLGVAPNQDAMFDFCPVDYLSQAIVYLSQREESFGKGFILKNRVPIEWRNLVEWIARFGYKLELENPENWIPRVSDFIKDHKESPLYRLMPLLEVRPTDRLVIGYPTYVKSFDLIEKRVTQQALAESDISCPPADDKLLNTYFSYLIQSGYLPQP